MSGNHDSEAANAPRRSLCPACGYQVAVPFFNGGQQPMATIAWPETAAEARDLPRLPLDFVRCIDCGHVYNAAFEYGRVPYSKKPNLMFNAGRNWSGFIADIRSRILGMLPPDPSVVEIGHGHGDFLASLAQECGCGQFVGFDPHGAVGKHGPVTLRRELFLPERHVEELAPDLIVARHVLEHLIDPLGLLQWLSFACRRAGLAPLAYLEVPCVDRLLDTGRTVDLYYEHNSQFTTESFTRMMAGCAADVVHVGHGYDGEVVYGFIRLGKGIRQDRHVAEARSFYRGGREAKRTVCAQLEELYAGGQRVAIWGGTGKSAAFMQRYGVDNARFPLVVDDDANKVDTFVPGTGQRIRFRDWLLDNPVDVVIVPPQWRAADIISVMNGLGIKVQSVLIEHDRRLVDYHNEKHPYRTTVT